MATWQEFDEEAGVLAAQVRHAFERSVSHVLATIRPDGSPRVSAIEVQFDGTDMTVGSMLDAVKARDLMADGRFALHAAPGEGGDAKVSGTAVEVHPQTRAERGAHLFRLDLTQAVFTGLGDDGKYLLIQVWRPGSSVKRFKRY